MALDLRAKSLDREAGRLSYAVIGDGREHHVVWFNDINQHIDLCWTDPTVSNAVSSLARDGITSLATQGRGLASSDPVAHWPTPDDQAADLLAILEAEGVERATLVGCQNTGLPSALVAAQRPDLVSGLVLINPVITGPAIGDSESGWTAETAQGVMDGYRATADAWGTGATMRLWDPGLCSPYNVGLIAMTERCSASQSYARAGFERSFRLDGRDVYPQVRVPTRVLRVPRNVFPERTVQAVADAIDGAEYHALPVTSLGDSIGSMWGVIARHAAELALGSAARTGSTERVLASVLFTDIVGSTDLLARMGDAAWSTKLSEHEQLVRREVTRTGGRVVDLMGDGTLCEFAGPGAAIECAQAICAAAPAIGLEIRAGIHTGECERRGDDLAGLAVHIGARVSGLAGSGEVLVSKTVRDLVTGSGTPFAPRGTHELRGVPDRWDVFAVGEDAAPAPSVATSSPAPTVADRMLLGVARRSPRALRAVNRVGNAAQRRRYASAA